MKRYEVLRHLLYGDFPRNQQYNDTSGCALQGRQRLSEVGCRQANRLHPTSTIFSLIIAHILSDEEQLAHALLASHLKEATFSDTNVQSILRISLRFFSRSPTMLAVYERRDKEKISRTLFTRMTIPLLIGYTRL